MASIQGIPLSKVSPAFLHANSTSHTWTFSAFAELIDNAYDPDVSASELLIDKVDIRGSPCLIFLDNGAGMDTDHLLKMLSFGFCEKDIYEKQGSHQPIGHYGNGFKSGSMRIGYDALVFTRCHSSASIGFLSQTYLKSMNTDSVMVPILEYRLPSQRIKSQESRNNLNAILEYSVFKMESELKEELKALEGSKTGTKIIIYNLKRLQDSTYELDFASDPTDIRCPEAHEADMTSVYHRPIQHNASEYKRSLREYCSILFLRPRMKITIRGVRVRSKLISKSLSNTEIDIYKPTWLSRPVKIIFGFNCDTQRSEDSDYGMMLYHRNRLIKAFEKVGYQRQSNGLGVGVVGVAQVDFLQPIHNKQDFNKDEKFNSVMAAFSNKLNDYWNEKKGSNDSAAPSMESKRPDWLWAQCDHCLKWRRLPDVVDSRSLPQLWFCRMNPDATHNRCDIPEEPEDEDLAVKPTYEKTFKKKQEERKRVQQMEKEKEEDIKRRKIMAKEQELKQKEATLRAIQQVAAAQPETRTVMTLQKALAEARRREEQQKRLILQIQEQKKVMEEERNSLLQMAESLQASNGNSNKEVLKQMSQLITPHHQDSLLPSPVSSGKRKSTTESLPNENIKVRKRRGIKTEPVNMLSVADNGIDPGGDDNFSTNDNHLFQSPSNQCNGSMDKRFIENTPAVKTEADKTPSVVTPPRQHEINMSEQSSSETPSNENGSLPHPANLLSDAASSHPVATAAKPGRKSPQKGMVVAVIDLTCESEFGELVDMKPNLEELRATLQDGLRYQMIDVKPDKDALDASLANTGGHDREQEAGAALKEEIAEAATQALSKKGPDFAVTCGAASNVKESNESEVLFRNNSACPDLMDLIPETFQNNLEAVISAIQERFEKDKSEQESGNHNSGQTLHDVVVKDEHREETNKEKFELIPNKIVVRGLNDGANSSMNSSEIGLGANENAENCRDGRRNNEIENKESDDIPATQARCLLQMDDFDGLDFVSDDSVDDRSDYRDCSKVDEKGEPAEHHIGRKKCNVISQDSRSNSIEHGDQSLKNFIGIEGEYSVGHESVSCSIQNQISGGFIDPVIGDLNFTDFPKGSNVGEPQDAGEQDLIGLATDENLKRGSVYSCVKNGKPNGQRKSNMMYTEETVAEGSSLYDGLSNPSKKYVKSSRKLMGKDTIKPKLSGEDSSCIGLENIHINGVKESHASKSSTLTNLVVVEKNLSSVRKRPKRGQVSSPTDFSVMGDNDGDYNEDDAFDEFNGERVTDCPMNSNPSRNILQSSEDSGLPPIHIQSHVPAVTAAGQNRIIEGLHNKSFVSNHEVKHSKLKRTSDQYMQTDLDMAAIKDIFQDDLVLKKFNQKDTVDNKGSQLMHKNFAQSFQMTDFSNSVETEVQTEDFNLDDSERLKELQAKLSLKTQLLENMEVRLSETYVNIHKLLGFIVPEAELGDVSNIDQVIKDMVRVSENSCQLQSDGSGDDS